jgi:hypothetical protein
MRNKCDGEHLRIRFAHGSSLTSISIVNRAAQQAFAGCPNPNEENEDGDESKRRIEARICCHGPRQTAGNRKQGWQGEPRRRTQEQREALTTRRE